MLDIKFIKENSDIVKKSIRDRQMEGTVDVDAITKLDDQRLDLLRQVETKRALKNKLSDDIAKVDEQTRNKLIDEAAQIKDDLLELEDELDKVAEKLNLELKRVPNLIQEEVPLGKTEEDNVVLRTWGKPKKQDIYPKDHVDLGKEHDLIDIETSAEVSGARFNYLKNEAALLQFALINFVLGVVTNREKVAQFAQQVKSPFDNPFIPVVPPAMLKMEVAEKMARLETGEDWYILEQDQLVLAGSAEHTLGPMHMGKTLEEKDLPLRYIGYSTSFRREAGTYGKDTKGILRVHQFDKLEMESFSLPEHGLLEQELMVAVQEHILQELEIPYQVVILCTGDMGKPDYRQIDINCWMPGQQLYRETHTSDYVTDYQARRLETKFKRENGERGYVHMNDATAVAIGRTLIAILENYQQDDGSILVPRKLQPYMFGRTKIG